MAKERCEILVTQAVEQSALIGVLLHGMNKAGCAFNLARHVACEACSPGLMGGYDKELNQVVICENKCTNLDTIKTILAHELVHMYDQCANQIDWDNVDHLACSEVRAANLVHCNFKLNSLINDGAPVFSKHSDCVERKAIQSVKLVTGLNQAAAELAVKNIFHRCYNDLEPVGRRCWGKLDQERAFGESVHWLSKKPK